MTEDLGANSSIDPKTTAVVVVDVQRLFTDMFPMPVEPPLEEVLPRMTRFLEDARTVGATVFVVRTIVAPDDHSRNTIQWDDYMRANMTPGSPGTEFDACLGRHPSDIEVVKQRYSAFVGTPLESVLRDRGISTVIVFGLTTNVCVQSTVRDSWQRDYLTITLSDCCSEVGAGMHDMSLAWTAMLFGRVCTSDELMSSWQARV